MPTKAPSSPFLKGLLTFGVLLGAAAVGVGWLRWKSFASGRQETGLICQQPEFDFGTLPLKDVGKLEHRFVLQNSSSHSIRITKVAATCGCTSAKAVDETVPANGSTQVIATINWAQKPGPQTVQLEVRTDNLTRPYVHLLIQGLVQVPAVLSYDSLNFGVLRPGEVAKRVIEVAPGPGSKPFHITGIRISSHCVTISRVDANDRPTNEPNEGIPGRFEVSVVAPGNAERENSVISFTTDIPEQSTLMLAVSAQFVGGITATPSSLLLEVGPGSEEALGNVRLVCENNSATPQIKILSKSSQQCFSVMGIEPIREEHHVGWTIRVVFKRKEASDAVSRAELGVTVGDQHLAVPLLGVSK
jgi:hypothetical protein